MTAGAPQQQEVRARVCPDCVSAPPDLHELANEIEFCPRCGGVVSLRLRGARSPVAQASRHFNPQAALPGREEGGTA
jgi:hypothetical protein